LGLAPRPQDSREATQLVEAYLAANQPEVQEGRGVFTIPLGV
jgi:hypothetical protein